MEAGPCADTLVSSLSSLPSMMSAVSPSPMPSVSRSKILVWEEFVSSSVLCEVSCVSVFYQDDITLVKRKGFTWHDLRKHVQLLVSLSNPVVSRVFDRSRAVRCLDCCHLRRPGLLRV